MIVLQSIDFFEQNYSRKFSFLSSTALCSLFWNSHIFFEEKIVRVNYKSRKSAPLPLSIGIVKACRIFQNFLGYFKTLLGKKQGVGLSDAYHGNTLTFKMFSKSVKKIIILCEIAY